MKKLKILVRLTIVVLILTGCAAGNVDCPTPPIAKLKKMSPQRWKYYKHLMKEKATARKNDLSYEMMRKLPHEGKKVNEMEEWDCPRPGTKHQRLIREKRRKLDRMHDKKKSEKDFDISNTVVENSKTELE